MKPLRNDCFALPPGVNWTPVEEALERLRSRLHPVVETEHAVPLSRVNGRILASDVYAPRAHPPSNNSAVDGYALAGPVTDVPCTLPLVDGRSAAGEPFKGQVPAGHAIRILTGAVIPSGTDTVVLEEDCEVRDGQLYLNGTLKAGANARKAGEDIQAQDRILIAGTRLTPTQISVLASVGVESVDVYQKLRVGVLSTGDEVKPVGATVTDWQIYDANRPMLSALVSQLGYELVDLGHALDRADEVKSALETGAQECDLILTSGGVSAGDEDHVSKTLKAHGDISNWRIAIKPGRPLALAMFQGTPVVGLPGNPVAAWVCALRFGAPAMALLAGGEWFEPQAYVMPANFSKNKKPGRSEMLRARVRDGQVEVFGSEGSGRVTGLAWSEGLVELDESAQQIEPGTPVRFIPYGSFGL
ncbi:molybdopterin-binding protein [Marinobacter adhaerens]|jgi:molybdopterin molybdotransferase|uniref:Molybdopterin molybdenumtransferase n=2 Tax=Marinobacter adhaerens TaxID=1033846 RepID=A0ABX8IKV3_9GAMM|nr:molybdopterin-binding protein [Marinobacter adhaerens]ADP99892.1 molybdopterin biosynthesis protein MoeA-like protein [Marinobacter adhaerens HP15]MBW4978225.1 molybdopterin molybdenumtransferase MoeA [Marinobacter adhaerens]MCR9188368.1 molybdopterin-binding protein [Alteromonadaceae bacterium]QWV13768.1 molybdopterin molybdenumtransferase MoeA [Marinobacter adhaerens]